MIHKVASVLIIYATFFVVWEVFRLRGVVKTNQGDHGGSYWVVQAVRFTLIVLLSTCLENF